MDAVKLQKAIKGYELKEKLGTGGFGAVYRAFQTTVGREVAVKVILPALANQSEFIRRFEGEAQVVARLEHPHITPLYDYWRDPEGAYLVMRWLKGGSLRDALDKGKFELRAAALLLDQIAGALSLAHRNGIIHRDIKPANILLDEDGNAYLTDFGIAKDLSISGSGTQPDMIVGSLDYISPEQARSESVSSRTDIYSLGVTLYEMIVGEHPFANMSPIERLYKHINDPLPDISGLENAAELNRVIQKASAKNPEQRYPDALAFAADFREAIGLNRSSTSVVELLTQREQEILQAIIEGLSNKEIAQKLTITHGTVKWYVNQIYEKLGVRSRVQAMVRARELNLIVKGNEQPLHVATEDFQAENPYKGLRAFQAADYQDFFGREKISAKLLKRMEEKTEFGRFLAVVGPSGSGKSSLVKAGLIPALWRGALAGSEKWYVVEMTPATVPLDELEIALTKLAANQAANLHEHLQRDNHGLLRAANLILPNDSSELLLVIDQFEEVFTLSDNEEARQHFLDLLYAAVTNAKSRVRVLITLRADFYDRPLHYAAFGEMLKSRLETILPLSAAELERAISKPAERVGAVFEAGLVASMVADLNYQAGALPLLQYALTELFEQRKGRLLSREAYEKMGKSTGALAKRADEIYSAFDEAGQAAAKQVFLRLVTVTEGAEDTRRRAGRAELLTLGDAELIEEVLDSYSSYRLLTLDNHPVSREPIVEVAHEAILREWERLREWLSESREELRIQVQVAAMAQEWLEAKQDKSFLARGSRLGTFEQWAETSTIVLTPLEQSFIKRSIEGRAIEAEKEAEQAARENVLKRRSVRTLRLLVGVLVLALAGAFVVAALVMMERDQAQSERDNARSLALASGAQLAYTEGDVETAVSLAWEANQIGETSLIAQRVLYDASTGYGIRQFFPNQANTSYTAIALSDNDQYLAALSFDGTISLWDTSTRESLYTARSSLEPSLYGFVAFSSDNHYFLSSSLSDEPILPILEQDYECVVRDSSTGQELARLDSPAYVWNCSQFINDGRVFLWGRERSSMIGTIALWNFQTDDLEIVALAELGDDSLFTASMTHDGQVALINQTMLASNSAGTWRWNFNENIRIEGNIGFVLNSRYRQIFVNPKSHRYVVIDQQILDVENELWASILAFHNGAEGDDEQILRTIAYTTADFSTDGRYVLTSDEHNGLVIWDFNTAEQVRRFTYPANVYGLSYSSNRFAALSSDGIRLWELSSNIAEPIISARSNMAILVNPDASLILLADGPFAQVFRKDAEQYIRMPQLIPRANGLTPLFEIDLSNDSRYMTSRSQAIWYITNLETNERLSLGYAASARLRFSPDARLVVMLNLHSEDRSIPEEFHILDADLGELISTITIGDYSRLRQTFAVSPDNSTLVVGLENGQIGLWDIRTGELLREFDGNGSAISNLSINATGSKLYAASVDGNLFIFDFTTANRLHRFERVGNISEMIISSDEQRISLTMLDNTIKILDANNGNVLRIVPINSLTRGGRVLDDGSAVIFVGVDGSVIREDLLLDRESLMNWVQENRYVAPLRCDQRELYQVMPLCEE